MSSPIRPRHRAVRPAGRPRLLRLEDRLAPSAGFYTPPSHYLVNPDYSAAEARIGPVQPLETGLTFLGDHAGEFGLSPADLRHVEVTDQYTDADTGISYLYLRQRINDLPVANSGFSIGIGPNGSVISAGGGFVAGLQEALKDDPLRLPMISALDAVRFAADGLDLAFEADATLVDPIMGPLLVPAKSFTLAAPSISLDQIPMAMQYVPTADGGASLSWQMVLRTPDGGHWYDASVDGATGELTSVSDWIDDASYSVIPLPNEHPLDGGFAVLTNPQDPVASPFGWHDTNGVAGAEFTDTRGNNVDAHLDRDANNAADANPPRPNGGAALNFSGFTFSPALAPSTLQNENAAVVNLFYVNNWLHDVHYKYGFTEAAGNFQTNNYGRGGIGNDAVQADAQDGSGTDNANFGTPADGSAPRMQMYEFTQTSPRRDSDNDNGIIAHEYAHGVSNRLTGGPANPNALNSTQSGGMGEGWGDFYALMFTQRASDVQNAGYPMGTYVLGQAPTGAGIRRRQYSFNMAIDPLTFDAYGTSGTTSYGIARSTEVHDSGELWASALWDMNWLLINKYGFDSNLLTGWSSSPGPAHAGNKLALRLVMEGMKLQPANPSFVQARDAIIAADVALNSGADRFEIWSAFARRGLGEGASTASADSNSVTLSTTLPMLVSSVVPATESIVATAPVDFTVSVTAAISAGTLDAADLLVNGQPADSVAYTAGASTATFSFASSPVTAEGAQSIEIASGAFTRNSDGSAVAAFSSRFYFDSTPLSVTSIAPAAGAIVITPLATVDVNFNQAVDPASVQNSDLTISRGAATGFSLLNGDTTVRFTISDAVGEGPVSVALAAGAFLDTSGNPSEAFSGGTYTLDYDTLAMPTPLVGRGPAGSLAYDGSSGALIGTPGDVDNFTVSLDAGQLLSVVVASTSNLQPSITVTGPGTNAADSAAAAGGTAKVSTIPIASAGTYTFAVSGVGSSTGTFTIRALLNTTDESEANGGAINDSIAAAQSLDGSLIDAGNGVSAATVRGRSEFPNAALVNEAEPNGTTATANAADTYTAIPSNNLYQLGFSGTISSSTDADYFNIGALQVGDVLTVTQSGSPSVRGSNADPLVRLYRSGSASIVVSDDDSGPGFDAMIYRYTIATAGTYYVRAHRATSSSTGSYQVAVQLENTGTAPATGGTFTAEVESNGTTGTANNAANAWRPVTHFASASGTISAGDTDIYGYQFTAGDVVTFAMRPTSGLIPSAALLNPAGAAIATENGTGGQPGTIYGYVIPATGTYYFRVTGASGSTGGYFADVNLSTAAALPTLPLGQDVYAFSLQARQSASAVVRGVTISGLDVSILGSGGEVAVSGVSGATNVNQIAANFVAPATGTYYLQVGGPPAIDYDMTLVTGGTFDAEANDSFATAQPLGADRAALGSISGNDDWYQFTVAVGESISLATATPGGGPGEWANTLDPRIELYDPANVLIGSDDNSAADGRNAALSQSAGAAGSYRVRVASAGGTGGEYTIKVSTAVVAAPRVAGVTVDVGSGQRSRIASLTVAFDRVVTLPPLVENAFSLTRDGGGAVAFQAFANIVGGATVVTLSGFSGPESEFGSLADGRYTLTVLSGQVSAGGLALDGNGDGTPGDDFTFGNAQGLFRYFGDASADGRIDISDFGQFSLTYNRQIGDTGFNPAFDFNNDSRIDIADFGQFSIRYFSDLP